MNNGVLAFVTFVWWLLGVICGGALVGGVWAVFQDVKPLAIALFLLAGIFFVVGTQLEAPDLASPGPGHRPDRPEGGS